MKKIERYQMDKYALSVKLDGASSFIYMYISRVNSELHHPVVSAEASHLDRTIEAFNWDILQ